VIAHGHRLLGEALAELLTSEPGFAVVGQAPDSQSAFRLAKQTLPTIVLLDLDTSHQPEHTVRQLLQLAPAPRVIILSNHTDPGSAKRMLALGAHGYLPKTISRQDLVLVIHRILASRSTVTVLDAPGGPSDALADQLTSREREVVALVARALSNRQIAIKLKITEGTVKRHLRNIFGKLGAVSRIDAVNKAGAALAPGVPVPWQPQGPSTELSDAAPQAHLGQERLPVRVPGWHAQTPFAQPRYR
jgi:two-component system, NarL family, nitrate/nitrite response regulator NarL